MAEMTWFSGLKGLEWSEIPQQSLSYGSISRVTYVVDSANWECSRVRFLFCVSENERNRRTDAGRGPRGRRVAVPRRAVPAWHGTLAYQYHPGAPVRRARHPPSPMRELSCCLTHPETILSQPTTAPPWVRLTYSLLSTVLSTGKSKVTVR